MTSNTTGLPARVAPSRPVLRRVAGWICARAADAWARRADAAAIGRLKPRDLRDIGLSEPESRRARGLPPAQDAADALQRAALGHRWWQ